MVLGAFVMQIPNNVFIVFHAVALAIGVYFAVKNKGKKLFPLFLLYSMAELSYLLYHIPVFNMLFSHVVAEAFLLVGVILVSRKSK